MAGPAVLDSSGGKEGWGRADPITLTLGAAHLDLSREAGEVFCSGEAFGTQAACWG